MPSASRNWELVLRALFLMATALIPVLAAGVIYLQFSIPPLAPLDPFSLLNGLVVAGTFWAVGALLLWRRFWDSVARLFFVMTQSVGSGLLFLLAYPQEAIRPGWMAVLISIGFHVAGALLVHFYLTFPIPLGRPHQRRRLLVAVYGLMLVALACRLSGTGWGLRLAYVYNTTEIMGSIAILIYTYWRRATPDGQRRLRLVVFGNAVPAVPGFLFYLLPTIAAVPRPLPDWMVGPFLLIAPLSYFLAIVRHNLFDLDRLLNRTLVYAILSVGILLLYLGPSLLLYQWAPDDWLAEVLIVSGLTLLVGLSFDWTRGRVQQVVDRIFYGGWYDYPRVVETISDALARCIEREQLREALTETVPALMQLREGQLLLGEQVAAPPLPPPQLQFPLAFQGQVRALWIVGARRDGEEFGPEDRRILKTLARQAEVALGNVLLVEVLRRQLDAIRESRETLAQAQRQLLCSREEERARLARDLHDGPIQDLVGLNMQLGLLLSSAAPPLSQALDSMRLQVRALLGDLRQVCAELRPPMLDTMGLGAALRVLGNEWSGQTGLPVQLELPPDATLRVLPGQVAVNLYRLAQEALTNVARHAAARSVGMRVEWEDDNLILTIRDDGSGFVVPSTFHDLAAQGHFGLLGMQERMGLIGGECTIDSATGRGTTVRVVWRGAAPAPEPMVDATRA